jgi:uncharacterized protein YjbJ (UPF0337 family)
VKEKWGKLTDDDHTQINGNREQLEGKIEARYGYAKDQVKKDVDERCGRLARPRLTCRQQCVARFRAGSGTQLLLPARAFRSQRTVAG